MFDTIENRSICCLFVNNLQLTVMLLLYDLVHEDSYESCLILVKTRNLLKSNRVRYLKILFLPFLNICLHSFTGSCGAKTTSRYCCSLPFIYKGRRYNSCTRRNHNRPWCSLTPNFDRDKTWANCASKSLEKHLSPKIHSLNYGVVFIQSS